MSPADSGRSFSWESLHTRLAQAPMVRVEGFAKSVVGVILRAVLPNAWVGELCYVSSPRGGPPLRAEVVGFRGNEALLMPLGPLQDIGMGSRVSPAGRPLEVGVGPELLGRVLNGLGEPLDRESKGELATSANYPVSRPTGNPTGRALIDTQLETGVRVLDGMLACGVGQRVGIFAGAGVGKSTLMGALARHVEADVVVVGLIGERGREVNEFLEHNLSEETRAKSVVVVATSDEPPLVRMKAAYVTTAIAEYFRDKGNHVLLLMDSVTRFARAQREIGLARGEPPARAGFPPSVFSELPILLERSGRWPHGAITAFYTVLVEGDDENEPVADEVRSILDGHIVLSRRLANAGIRPAIDVPASVSRIMPDIVDSDHLNQANEVGKILSAYYENKEAIDLGYYRGGNRLIDLAKSREQQIRAFTDQGKMAVKVPLQETLSALRNIVSP